MSDMFLEGLTSNPRSLGPYVQEGIERREWAQLGRKGFTKEFLNPLKPVIVTGAINHWSALGSWTLEFFRDRHGDFEVTVDQVNWRLGDLIDRILASSADEPAPYLRNYLLAKWPQDIQAAVTPMPDCTAPNWLNSPFFPSRVSPTYEELYIGGAGTTFPVLHYDYLHTHAFLMQVYGEKEYLVFSPEQTPYMYPREGREANKSNIDHSDNPDLDRFPFFARACGMRFRLLPGETLFVPAGWWHTARILSPSITVSVNAANAPNWKDFSRDYCRDVARRSRLKAALLLPYMAAMGDFLSSLEWFGL